jgi:hypothetical protein
VRPRRPGPPRPVPERSGALRSGQLNRIYRKVAHIAAPWNKEHGPPRLQNNI